MRVVDAVIILFKPSLEGAKQVIGSLAHQVRILYVIDNSPQPTVFDWSGFNNNIEYISLGENKGIAEAQNIGIKRALSNHADLILLSDQDSVFPKDYISSMLSQIDDWFDVAAVVPQFCDENQSGKAQGFLVPGFWGAKRYNGNGEVTLELAQAIASGKLINAKMLNQVGLMDSRLFIDWVDLEWCWRARSKGFKVLGLPSVKITHCLGDESKQLPGRTVTLRSPLRHYYITRNAFYLALRSENLSAPQRVFLFVRSLRYLVAFPLLSKPRKAHFVMVLKGFWHGLLGRLGRYQNNT